MVNKKVLFLLTLGAVYLAVPTECARILGVFPFAASSHYTLGNSLMRGLAAAGHDVTVISPYEDKNPPNNGSYTNVVLTGFVEEFNRFRGQLNLFTSYQQLFLKRLVIVQALDKTIDAVFSNADVKALLNSNEKFDAVIVEQFFNEATKIFAYHFNAPLILFSTIGANSWVNNIAGNPAPPSYIPHMLSDFSTDMTFFERLQNLFFYVLDYVMDYFYIVPNSIAVLKKHFPDSPDFFELYHNASLILLNSHGSFQQAVPLVPNMVEIGGFHVASPKGLPKDLQDYLDDAKEGVVYFSMGSNMKSRDLPPERRDMFLKAFSKLKQKVLWKWEDDVLPGQPDNVKLKKWMPQQDILAHPNVKLFITHGGLLSTIETICYGVPILAIPVFGDQHSNAQNAVRNGYGLSLAFNDPNFSEEKLSDLLNELLNNPKYTENVKSKSEVYHNRPLKPMENAIFWIEYVIHHKGAPHLRVAGARMPLYQYLLLDVIAFVIVVTILAICVPIFGLCYYCRGRHSSKVRKLKKN